MSSSQGNKQNIASVPGSSTQEFVVRVPKNVDKVFQVMKFNAALKADFSKWSQVAMERENNLKEFRTDEDAPKFGAGSEYGREFREEARRKKYGIISKKYNPEDQPWLLRVGDRKNGKRYKGIREGGITENASYYVFMQAQDGAYEAFPIKEWYNFTPIQTYKTLNAEEAEEEFGKRDKIFNYFNIMMRKRLKNEEVEGEEDKEKAKKGGKKYGQGSGDFKISDMDDWVNSSEEEEEDEEGEKDDKESKDKKKNNNKKKVADKKKGKKKKKDSDDSDPLEDSDDGDEEGREVDYISDESSSEEEPEKLKVEMKGVEDEEAIRKMEDSESEEENPEEKKETEEPNEEGQPKETKASEKNKKDKKEAPASSSESSSDTSDSDDFDNEKFQSAMFMQKSKKGKKDGVGRNTPTKSVDKRKEHGQKRANQDHDNPSSKKAKLDSSVSGKGSKSGNDNSSNSKKVKLEQGNSSSSANSSAVEGITEEAVKRYLMRKPMTTTELLQKFKSKKIGLSGDQLVMTITPILKRLNLEKQTIKGKMYISLKQTKGNLNLS